MDLARFAPTENASGIHVGHLINLFVNLFYVKQKGGKLCVRIDRCGSIIEMAQRQALYENMVDSIRIFLPDVRIFCCYFDLDRQLFFKIVQDKTGIDLYHLKKNQERQQVEAAVLDYLQGVNVIIRGKDWQADSFLGQKGLGLCDYIYRSVLQDLLGRKLFYRYSPILTVDGLKMSNSIRNQLSIEIEQDFEKLGWLLYIVSLLEGELLSIEDLLGYENRFDIDRVCMQETVAHDDELVRKCMRESEQTGNNKALRVYCDILHGVIDKQPVEANSQAQKDKMIWW